MSIIQISRDWGSDPSLVRIVSTNTLSEVGTANYVSNQRNNIEMTNSGEFEWLSSDMALVKASDGWGLFTISSDFLSLNVWANGGNVLFPVIDDHVVVFNGTSGQMKDGGGILGEAAFKNVTDNTVTRVAGYSGAPPGDVGNLPGFGDIGGSLADSGIKMSVWRDSSASTGLTSFVSNHPGLTVDSIVFSAIKSAAQDISITTTTPASGHVTITFSVASDAVMDFSFLAFSGPLN